MVRRIGSQLRRWCTATFAHERHDIWSHFRGRSWQCTVRYSKSGAGDNAVSTGSGLCNTCHTAKLAEPCYLAAAKIFTSMTFLAASIAGSSVNRRVLVLFSLRNCWMNESS